MASQSKATGDVSYYNHSYRAHIQTLPNVPWFLVTTYDKEYLGSSLPVYSDVQYYRDYAYLRSFRLTVFTDFSHLSSPDQTDEKTPFLPLAMALSKELPVRLSVRYKPVPHGPSNTPSFSASILSTVWCSCFITGAAAHRLPQTLASFLIAIVFAYGTAFALLKEQRDRRYHWVLASSVALSLFILLLSIGLTTVNDSIDILHLVAWLMPLFGALFYVTRSTFKVFTKANQKPAPSKKKPPVQCGSFY